MFASRVPIPFVPLKLTVAVRPVGISYTWLALSAATVYSRVTPPNVKLSVGAMACLAVGVIAYVRLVALVALEAYVAPLDETEYRAPGGIVAAPKLHTSVAGLFSVTVDPPNGPVLATATVVDARVGNSYSSDAETETVDFVRVAANRNVKLLVADAVTVASMVRVCANVVPSTTVVGTLYRPFSAL